MKYIKEQNELEIVKARELAEIETGKFKNMVDSIGPDTIATIATAGPEMQVSEYIYIQLLFTQRVRGTLLMKLRSLDFKICALIIIVIHYLH